MTQTERDQNLMIVVAAEEYAARHNLKTSEAFRLFNTHHINTLIRSQYGALHTQALEESGYFAEDLLASSAERSEGSPPEGVEQ